MQPLTLPPELLGPAPSAVPDSPRRTVPIAAVAPKAMLAKAAGLRLRHQLISASFALCVAVPLLVVALYLYTVAHDQFASTVGFSVREDDTSAAADLLGGLTDLSGGSASNDADILYNYIYSQNMVRQVAGNTDLIVAWSVPGDPVFGLVESPTIEDLLSYWQRMVLVHYDTSSGLIEVRVNAFTPDAAQAIATAIMVESRDTINRLSDIAQADATRFARADMKAAQDQLVGARQLMTQFRSRNKIIDPTADIQGRMGLLNSLQAQQAEAMIAYDLLLSSETRAGDPRLDVAKRRVEVVQELIAAERARYGLAGAADESYNQMVSQYENLAIDLEFAEKSYLTARVSFDAAVADAKRTSKYLAAHITPTLAERAEYPLRLLWLTLIGGTLFLVWAIGLLIYYSVRDRR
ncbi:MAG: sugar transporter [Planktomarina sp.]